jgi:hypothetical protein
MLVMEPIGVASHPAKVYFTLVDIAILVGCALFAFASFLGRWKGITPFVFLGSDAGIVSSFVASYQHPDLFVGDALLSDFNNFRYYLAFHPLLLVIINRLTGDYGTAYVSLLMLTVFLQSSGFYLLGRVLYYNRYWALLLTIMTLSPIALPIREFWGVYDDPLPRSLFHACLPFILAAAFFYRSRVAAGPWLMAALGLSFYAHPVSAPPWAFAIWLGIWACLPVSWSWYRRSVYMLSIGLIFVATVAPWLYNFWHVHDHAVSSGVQYKDAIDIIAERVGKELLDVRLALELWWQALSSWPLSFYCGWAICGSVALWRTRPETRKDLGLIAIWACALLFVSIGLTFIEETLCRALDLKRLQMDSIRGIKYVLPLVMLMCLWPLSQIGTRKAPAHRLRRTLAMGVGALLVAVWAFQNPPVMFVDAVRSWTNGSLTPSPSISERATIQALDAVRNNTSPRALILPLALPLEIRYSALRPVAYAYKDGGIFADTNLKSLFEWDRVKKEIESIRAIDGEGSKLKGLLDLSSKLGAEYLLTDFPVEDSVASSVGAELVWSNESFALLRTLSRNKNASLDRR